MNEPQIQIESQNEELVIASFFERVIAFILDLALFNLIIILAAFLVIKFNLITDEKGLKIFTYCAYSFLFIYFTLGNKIGKTFGKFLVGIEVLNKDEKTSLTFIQSLFRTFGYLFDLITLGGGFLLALFNKKRRALHDFIGSSIVISIRKKSPGEEMIFAILGTIIMGLLIFLAYYNLYKAPSLFDKKRIEMAQVQLNNLAYLEEVHKASFGYYTDDLKRLSLISGDGVQLNRDLQNAFKRRGFKIGLSQDKNSYRIEGFAKDSKESLVFKEKEL